MVSSSVPQDLIFQSTLSLRRATERNSFSPSTPTHFNPRSPCGERLLLRQTERLQILFQSTLSLRRATHPRAHHSGRKRISIHALLAESDVLCAWFMSPCTEFQSTLSLRRATSALRPVSRDQVEFQSTLSLRRATVAFAGRRAGTAISIHALLAESDRRLSGRFRFPGHFNPRSPCGERLLAHALPPQLQDFNPRSPCGERLHICGQKQSCCGISIHALLAESDRRPERQ